MMKRLPRAFSPGCIRFFRPQFASPTTFRASRRTLSQQRYLPSGEPVRFQAVRFKPPRFFSGRRFLTYVVYTSAVVGYIIVVARFFEVTIEVIDEEELEQEQGQTQEPGEGEQEAEGDDESFYAEDDSIFVPLTWSRKLPRSYYRGSDPEWQEFIKIANDKSRHKRIQNELVTLVFTGSTRHPTISRQLGKDQAIGKYWLDIVFPDGPPQEYERSGIEIGDGFVAWSQQRVSQENQWRLMRAIWPSAAAGGMWAAMSTLAGIQYRRVKQALGLEEKDPHSIEERYRLMMEAIAKQQQSRQSKGDVSKPQTEPSANPGRAISPADPSSTVSPQKRVPWSIPIPVPTSAESSNASSTSNDLPIAQHVFSHTLSKSWQPKTFEPPRGACVVQGMVEVRGSRGRMLLDVQGAYDPRQAKYVRISLAVRSYKRWKQSPLGGD